MKRRLGKDGRNSPPGHRGSPLPARRHKPFAGTTPIIQSVPAAISVYCLSNSLGTMKLDDWLTRLVAVPPGRSPLANGLAIGMRIALFILIPLGIVAAVAIVLLHR
jgi:hypothetical protein